MKGTRNIRTGNDDWAQNVAESLGRNIGRERQT